MGGEEDASRVGERATAHPGRSGDLDVPAAGWCLDPVGRKKTTPLWIALLLLGCKGEGEGTLGGDRQAPSVTRLDVRDRTPKSRHPAPELSAKRLQKLVRTSLRANTSFDVPEVDGKPNRADERATYRASVEISLSRQAAPAAVASVGIGLAHVYIQMDRISGGEGIESHGAEASAERPEVAAEGDQDAFWVELLRDATARAFHMVALQVAARSVSIERLKADLSAEDAAVRQEAVRELGRRGERSALDGIAALLDDPQQDVVLASVGALTSLRDVRAARALIASTRGRSNQYLVAVIAALRTLGGVESEAYLDALATGHGSHDIKSRATRALLDVRALRYRRPEDRGPR